MYTVSLSMVVSEERPTIVIGEEGNRKNVNQGGMAWKATDNLQGMTSESPPVFKQESLAGKVSTLIRNVGHNALVSRIEVLGDVLVGEKSWIGEFEKLKEESDRLLKEVNLYKIENRK